MLRLKPLPPSLLDVLKEKPEPVFILDLDSLAAVEPIQGRLNLAAKLFDSPLALLQQPRRLADNPFTALRGVNHYPVEFAVSFG